MNIDTNHLVCIDTPEEMERLKNSGYEPVPLDLQEQANLELMGKKQAYVGKRSTGSISRWAKEKREKKKKLAMAGKIKE